MPASFWVRRFLLIFAGAFALLTSVYLLRGRGQTEAVTQAAIWAGVVATLFIATRLYHSSRGRKCELCQDMPADAVSDESTKKTQT